MVKSSKQAVNYQNQQQLLTEVYISLSKDPRIWSADLGTALQLLAEQCAQALEIARVSIWKKITDDNLQMQCMALYHEDATPDTPVLDLAAAPEYHRVITSERLIEVSHAAADPSVYGMRDYLQQFDIQALLDSVIRVEGKMAGLLSFESVGCSRLWNDYEKNFLTSVAALLGQLFTITILRDSENRYRALFDGAGDAIFVMCNGYFADCNVAAEAMFGYSARQFKQLHPVDISPPYQVDGHESASQAQLVMQQAQHSPQRFEWLHCRADGSLFDAEVTLKNVGLDNEFCLMAIVRDITERKRNEAKLAQSRQELEYRANHDSLTGLPNRNRLHDQIAHQLSEPACQQQGLALMLMDLNRFKEVNDTLGHRFGDRLLKQVAKDLHDLLVPQQVEVFRLGGDEFVVLLAPAVEAESLLTLAQQICASVAQPRYLEGLGLTLSASIGIARFPEHGQNSHDLLRCADIAMYHAKSAGRGATLYEQQLDSYSPEKLTLMSDLGQAIHDDQLRLHFQPRIELNSGRCIGCEALLRWQHPQQGMIPPGDFIPAAEMSELIHPLSQWVLQHALQQCRYWLDEGIELLVAINLSARNLMDLQCPQLAAQLLQQFDIPAYLLEIEITESALIDDPERALEALQQFRQLGISIAIDDFGTGYSSLSYLKRLPIQTLKIDRSFVMDMLTDQANDVIVRSTIALAHSFSLTVVAEGVEDQATVEALQALGCDQAQGFHISRPLPADQFSQWLRQQER